MASNEREIYSICRFCLCQDEEYLIPITKMLDSTLTIEDVERFTGIKFTVDEAMLNSMCLECTNSLKNSVTFRTNCMNNNSIFYDLTSVLITNAGSIYGDTVEYLDSEFEEEDEKNFDKIDEKPFKTFSIEPYFKTKSSPQTTYEEEYIQDGQEDTLTSNNDEQNEDDFPYSANRIEPGESLSDEDMFAPNFFDQPSFKKVKKSPKDKNLRGRRKLHLCNWCGIFVHHIPSHVLIHKEEATFSCPYCSVKMKQKGNLSQHIQTVHFKTVGKTCEICGKGFIHHKTYRYHMLTHQDAGNSFECQVCSKQFNRSSGLEDHLKKFHSIVRNFKIELGTARHLKVESLN
ncbi:protein odd-skipped-related 2-like [Anopheles moucheti]|uniref:protein odd-skipped-related 2-like n=1 Tax=Anopheles moucheti TaxID=186751 RepID=UPI0022F054D2|nr:protein odd-skipped-related 2-like [Anopheles moucheti]